MSDTPKLLTADELRAIEERAEAATPGPWRWIEDEIGPGCLGWGEVAYLTLESQAGGVVDSESIIASASGVHTDGVIFIDPPNKDFVGARADVPHLLHDLRVYRDFCRRLLDCHDGQGDVFELAGEVRVALVSEQGQ